MLISVFHPAVFNACCNLHQNLELTRKPDREIPGADRSQPSGFPKPKESPKAHRKAEAEH